MSKTIAIANQKGGVGKTTTSVNLSACVAQAGCRTLLIDFDPQGNSSSGLGVVRNKPRYTAYDILMNDVPMEKAILPTNVALLDLLPANISLAGAEVELVSQIAREQVLKNMLAPVKERYDYIFIDCPPSLGLLTVNALTAATCLLVPIQCEYYALEGLSQLMNTVKLVRQNLNTTLEVEGVVLTMFDARTNLAAQVVSEVQKFFQEKVYSTIIPRSVRLSEAPSYGVPITLYDPRSSGARAYVALAGELMTEIREKTDAEKVAAAEAYISLASDMMIDKG